MEDSGQSDHKQTSLKVELVMQTFLVPVCFWSSGSFFNTDPVRGVKLHVVTEAAIRRRRSVSKDDTQLKTRHDRLLYQQEIKHFYWSFVYMKLYNNSQKTPQSESPHKSETKLQNTSSKMKVIHSKYNCVSGKKQTPQTVLRDHREKFHAQNTQAGGWCAQRQLGSFHSIRF